MRVYLMLLVVAVTFVDVCPVDAEMYHWVDASGVNHYTNEPPPPGVKAKSSWAEIQYNETAAKAAASENERVLKETETQDAIDREKAKETAAHQAITLDQKTRALEAKRDALANEILTQPFNFRGKAQSLIWQIEAVNAEILNAGNDVQKAMPLIEKRLQLWNKLFTERYVIRDGFSLMKQYQAINQELSELKR